MRMQRAELEQELKDRQADEWAAKKAKVTWRRHTSLHRAQLMLMLVWMCAAVLADDELRVSGRLQGASICTEGQGSERAEEGANPSCASQLSGCRSC